MKSISMEVTGEEMPVVLTYGGGTNSSAILVELIKRRYKSPDLIIFADTGAEMPHTYRHIEIMDKYAKDNGYCGITVVRNEQPSKDGGIYNTCLRTRSLPSVVYGRKQCSAAYKIEPVTAYVKRMFDSHVKIIGYDYDEIRRSQKGDESKGSNINWYPLIEWEMGRDECVQSLADAGLPPAGKSSCFICPNMRPHEIKKMAAEYPELIEKAIALEDAAAERRTEDGKQSGIYGLGRAWRWRDLIATDDMFGFADLDRPAPCGCYDGDE